MMFNNLWVEKYRPPTFEDIVLTPQVRAFCDKLKRDDEIPHILFCSAPGSGKTTLAKAIVNELDLSHRYINASDERGIDTIREKVVAYAQTKSFDGRMKVIILDETDGLTGEAQRALRNVMEEYSSNVRFILTANYKNRITKPILSRVQYFEIVPPLDGCTKRIVHILKKENVTIANGQKEKLRNLINNCYPDLRLTINTIQQNTVNGLLTINENVSHTIFAGKIIQMIEDNESTNEIRKFIIESEVDFGNNYHNVLKGMYEYVFSTVEDENKKRDAMLTIGKHMFSHQQVMDFEINCFCCIIELLKIFND